MRIEGAMSNCEIHHSDCVAFMRTLADNSVDSIVTDPPYELGFMGKGWDKSGIANSVEMWGEALRILKPGGHLLAFSGSRTYHRMTCAIEDAGFEVRDQIMWLYGSGFPKSHNLKDEWQGWGTALKPAHEPICVARKPLIGTVANNVLTWGTGAVNVDGCRVGIDQDADASQLRTMQRGQRKSDISGQTWGLSKKGGDVPQVVRPEGRWPANVIHDGSEEVVAGFPETKSGTAVRKNSGGSTFGGNSKKPPMDDLGYSDTGSAARFFYCAKASKRDRDEGLEGVETRDGKPTNHPLRANHHPTVKPTDLMRYLCRLVTPPEGTVFDPFTGSGSTGKAAVLEGFNFIGCDMTAEYVEIARARVAHALKTIPNKLDL